MTNVMRPSGPLPPRVYWVRRGTVLGVLVLVASLGWLFTQDSSGGAREQLSATAPQDASTGSAATTSAPSDDGTSEPSNRSAAQELDRPEADDDNGGGTRDDPAAGRHQPPRTGPDRRPGSGPTPSPSQTEPTELPEPTGDCRPADVGMEIDVSDSVAGRSNVATFILTSRTVPACILAITPDALVIQVTSGDDVIWSSSDCPDAVAAKQVVVRTDPATVYDFDWNGKRSTEDCDSPGDTPEPGGYWVEAALVGGEPHKAFFDIGEP